MKSEMSNCKPDSLSPLGERVRGFALSLLLLLLLLLSSRATAGEIVTATITLTNIPAGLPTNITLNGSTRVWTNNASGAPGTSIQITNTVANSATNLLNHLTDFPVDTGWFLSQSSPTNVIILGQPDQALTITFNPSPGWAFVTYSTQTLASPTFVVTVPITVETATNQTNIASLLVKALSDSSTNALATNSTAGSNFLTKGASPVQTIASPVTFLGILRAVAGGGVALTNGFTSSITNINSVSSNHVNYGNALRSEGPGGNSLQLGSNAMAVGSLSAAIGNSSVASNANALAVGTAAQATNSTSTAVGTSALAGGDSSTALGGGAQATRDSSTALGESAVATADEATSVGRSATASGSGATAVGTGATATAPFATSLGGAATASAGNSLALGQNAQATHTNSTAIGTLDQTGTSVGTTDTNQIRIGTANNRISAPGLYESPKSTNAAFAGTNVARGSWNYPAFALTTLAAGNNISVPFGTNVYIRCGSGPASAATICGIIGGATSGGLDGQIVEVLNDTGFGLTFAVNTVDPVTRNRINTPLGTDVLIADQASARLLYDDTDQRWKLISPFSVTASATNAVGSIFTNGVVVSSAATNVDIVTGSNVVIRATNTSGNVQIQINAIVNTNGSLPLPINNAKPALTNMPSFEGNYLADELLFPRTNAAGTDIALSANWSFTVPIDYATNTATLRILHSITATNGPNSSNLVWRASFLHSESGTTTDLRVGSFGTALLVTNTIAACFNCTNQLAISTISFTNVSGLSPGGLGILKLERVSTFDTYVGASSLIGLQIDYGK